MITIIIFTNRWTAVIGEIFKSHVKMVSSCINATSILFLLLHSPRGNVNAGDDSDIDLMCLKVYDFTHEFEISLQKCVKNSMGVEL